MKIPHCISQNVSLKKYNWYEIGGSAHYFAEPQNLEELQSVISFSQEYNISIKTIGLGANILIADEGYEGIILKLPNKNISHRYINQDTGILEADAGCSLDELINYSLEKAFLFGLEEFSGIPSSVGGALFINLHYFSFLISQFVYQAKIFNIVNNTIHTVDNQWFEFGYDNSKIKNNNHYIILSASFLLKRNTSLYAEYAKGRKTEITRHRQYRYPYQKTCGCFFKNILEKEGITNASGKKIIAASYYLDKVGVRGELTINDCSVSFKHANMITHNGNGTSKDIISIAKIMQEKVLEKYGFLLEPECELIGFSTYPLYKKNK